MKLSPSVVRVRPPNEWEADRLPSQGFNDSAFMGDGHLTATPRSSNGSLRPIVQVMDDKVLIFDPKDPDVSRAFEQKGFAPPGTKRYKDHRYTFDRIFNEDARQIDVYENTTRPLLDGLLDGFNATVFAYGVSIYKIYMKRFVSIGFS
jgi:kinesin family protein 18/19